MCLCPVCIVNPEYRMNADKFIGISLDGDFRPNTPCGDGHFYIARIPHSSKLPALNEDTVCNYVGIYPDGSCVEIYRYFPCGHCLECLARKQSDIRNRMVIEQSMYDCPPLFLTLTYNDKFLPANGVVKDDISSFFNRLHLLMSRAGVSSNFKHICFSEYGSLRHRPHYHAIIFGVDLHSLPFGWFSMYQFCSDAWTSNSQRKKDTRESMGFIHLKSVDSRAFRYVSKYVGKDMVENVPFGMRPNFISSSRRFGGIGTTHLDNPELLKQLITPEFPKASIRDRAGVIHNIVVPAYIRDKLYPKIDKFIPYRVQRILKNLAFDIEILKRYTQRSTVDPLDVDQSLMYFPVDLRQKFFHVSHLFNPLLMDFRDPYFVRMYSSSDIVGVQNRILRSISFLRAFYLHHDELCRHISSRVNFINRFLHECKLYFDGQIRYSPFARYNKLHSQYVKDYKSRVLDLQ